MRRTPRSHRGDLIIRATENAGETMWSIIRCPSKVGKLPVSKLTVNNVMRAGVQVGVAEGGLSMLQLPSLSV